MSKGIGRRGAVSAIPEVVEMVDLFLAPKRGWSSDDMRRLKPVDQRLKVLVRENRRPDGADVDGNLDVVSDLDRLCWDSVGMADPVAVSILASAAPYEEAGAEDCASLQ